MQNKEAKQLDKIQIDHPYEANALWYALENENVLFALKLIAEYGADLKAVNINSLDLNGFCLALAMEAGNLRAHGLKPEFANCLGNFNLAKEHAAKLASKPNNLDAKLSPAENVAKILSDTKGWNPLSQDPAKNFINAINKPKANVRELIYHEIVRAIQIKNFQKNDPEYLGRLLHVKNLVFPIVQYKPEKKLEQKDAGPRPPGGPRGA